MYKKVLLRERKRHTYRDVLSTPSVVLYPGVPLVGGYPCQGVPNPCLGVPPVGPGWGTPIWNWWGGTPTRGTPLLDLARVPPVWTWLGSPPSGPGLGTPPKLDLAGVIPRPGGVIPRPGGVPPRGQTDGWMDGQTHVKTLPSRRTTYAVGKNIYADKTIHAKN